MSAESVQRKYEKRGVGELIFAWFSVLCAIVVFPFGLFIIAAQGGFEVSNFVIFAAFFLATGFAVSAGHHRLFSHRSFVPSRGLKIALAILAQASAQGYLLRWSHDHRLHHRFTDQPGDPHSPYYEQNKRLSILAGLIHAHFLWLVRERRKFRAEQIGDLCNDSDLVLLDRASWVIVAGFLILPGISAVAFVDSSIDSFLSGLFWGGFFRIGALNNVTWAVNSFGHRFGSRVPAQKPNDQARNNPFLGVLAFGDGWHASHHADPMAMRHGERWSQIDITYYVLRVLAFVGWISSFTHRRRRVLTR